MNPNVGSPVQNFQGNGISPSPQMARVIPSQANNRYMQHMNVQQQQQAMLQQQQQQQQQQQNMNNASPSLHNPAIPSYGSPQHHQQPQLQPQPQPQIPQQPQDLIEDPSKNYNANMNFVQQSPMQQHASPIPRQSATPGSTHSTPRQQHQQLDTSTPHMSPAIAAAHTPTTKLTPMIPSGAIATSATTNTSPSPKPSNAPSETASPAANTASAMTTSTTTDQKDSPPPQQPKQQITYIPKTRNVETYGGVDLKYFDKFEIKPPVPHLNELGVVDIQALIMSLKSGMKMELTNALNVLTVLTVQPQIHAQQQQQPPHLPLHQCDDLLDVLLDYLEQDILGTSSRFPTLHDETVKDEKSQDQVLNDLTYTDLALDIRCVDLLA
ncbi:hypothetical protein G6F42_023354 [Rhizopus arrhizus]|nr:hypothetical protein G6F42_023354 [Rhizopus arrhizus]